MLRCAQITPEFSEGYIEEDEGLGEGKEAAQEEREREGEAGLNN